MGGRKVVSADRRAANKAEPSSNEFTAAMRDFADKFRGQDKPKHNRASHIKSAGSR
jgi:hypothetical protein